MCTLTEPHVCANAVHATPFQLVLGRVLDVTGAVVSTSTNLIHSGFVLAALGDSC